MKNDKNYVLGAFDYNIVELKKIGHRNMHACTTLTLKTIMN